MHAPALGQILAEMLAGETTAVDVRPLRPSRFREGEEEAAPELRGQMLVAREALIRLRDAPAKDLQGR